MKVYARKWLQRWALKSKLSLEGNKNMRGMGVREGERGYSWIQMLLLALDAQILFWKKEDNSLANLLKSKSQIVIVVLSLC